MAIVKKLPPDFKARNNCLDGKIILVTGAGDGIGRVAALTFASHGATLLLLGKTQKNLESVYDEIEAAHGQQPALLPFDLANNDPAAHKNIAENISTNFGRLDGLLHNASILGERSSIESYKPKSWFDTLQVNLHAPFLLTQALLPLLKKGAAASIVFTSSGVGRKGRAYWGAYGVSKFATEGLMQTLADELEETSKVRCNCINPGPTRTAMRARAYPAENPATLPAPESLMPLYLYLMSDESCDVNGETFDAQPR